MALIVTLADFVGEINIPGTHRDEIAKQLNPIIEKYEEIALRELLGVPLYQAYKTGIVISPADQRWIDLRDGKSYTYYGTAWQWDGLKQKNFLANFVYYYWMKNLDTLTATVGEVKPTTENAVSASPIRKMVTAWNSMERPIKELFQYLNTMYASYPEWKTRTNTFRRINEFNI